jgi:hypothetical protein
MIVKCISAYPDVEQVQRLGPGFLRDHAIHVTIGREYVVLSLTVNTASGTVGNGVWIDVLMEPDVPTVIPVPLCLFEIVDPRASRYWEIGVSPDGSTTLEPPSFSRKSFLEDVSDRIPEAVKEFWHLYSLLETEAIGAIRKSLAGG